MVIFIIQIAKILKIFFKKIISEIKNSKCLLQGAQNVGREVLNLLTQMGAKLLVFH